LVPLMIQVAVKPPKDGYSEKNSIRYLVPDKTAAPPSRQPSPPAAQPPASPAAAPWNRNS